MEGYEVITSDEKKAGHIVAVRGELLIVEHGTVLKARHALPRVFAHVDDEHQSVQASISKDLLDSSPKLHGDEIDETLVAEHYGLAAADPDAPTRGAGDLLPSDPARTAEDDALRAGVEPGPAAAVRIREELRPGSQSEPTTPDTPGLLGGHEPRRD